MNKSNIEITPTPGDGTMFFNGHSANLPAYTNTSNLLGNDEIFISVASSLCNIFHTAGKIYTLLEATITNEKQLEATKDIVRGYISNLTSDLEKVARSGDNPTPNYHAILTVHGYPDMDKETINRLIEWLQEKAKDFKTQDKKRYSNIYSLRLMK